MKSLFSTLLLVPFLCLGQTFERPEYAPRKEKHKNKTDELGRKQGYWKFYKRDGILILEAEYENDRRNGTVKEYYGNGRLMRETEYKYGMRDGAFRRYDYDGVITEGEYSFGKRTGRWTDYYNGGSIRAEGDYVDGRKNGTWKYYGKKGQLLRTILFKDGIDSLYAETLEKKAKGGGKSVSSH